MASGAVAGFVFASPPVDTIYKAIRTLAKYNDSMLFAQIISIS